jgi:hypothetical protein
MAAAQADQLELFCGHCAGSGVVMNYATTGEGECQVWPSPVPGLPPGEHLGGMAGHRPPARPTAPEGSAGSRPLSGPGRPQPATGIARPGRRIAPGAVSWLRRLLRPVDPRAPRNTP